MGLIFWLCVAAIIYIYLGYPAIVIAWAAAKRRLRPAPTPVPPDEWPTVTVLIAAFNEEAVIGGKIANTLWLDYPADKLDVLVVADGSTDDTTGKVQSIANPRVTLTFEPVRRGKSAALRRAFSQATGEIVVLSDANNDYSHNALKALVTPFSDPTVGAVGGAKVIINEDDALSNSEGLYWRYESAIKKAESTLGTTTAVSGEILAVQRDAYHPPPAHVLLDDLYGALSLIKRGFRVLYEPTARSTEPVSATAADENSRRKRIIGGRFQLMALGHRLLPLKRPRALWQILSHKYLRPFVPLFMIGALVANIAAALSQPSGGLLALAAPFGQLALAAQTLFYALALLGNAVSMGGKVGKLLYLPTFLLNSNLAALGGLLMFLGGKVSPVWQQVNRRTRNNDGVAHRDVIE